MATGDARLSVAALAALAAEETKPSVSAVTAWEVADLQARERLPPKVKLQTLLDTYEIDLVDLPAGVWRLAASLPRHHLDPVDRMLIAHAVHSGMTLVTADKTIRKYPVPTLW